MLFPPACRTSLGSVPDIADDRAVRRATWPQLAGALPPACPPGTALPAAPPLTRHPLTAAPA